MRSDISIIEAISLVRAAAPRLTSERVPLLEAYGRTLAEPLASRVDHPSCNNSALDGYACRAADTQGASPERPVRLKVVGDVPAGALLAGTVAPGQAVGIYTGSPMPPGTDAVAAVEDTERDGAEVLLSRPASPDDIRPRGQDLLTGEVYLQAGQRLGPAAVGVAAAMGYAELPVIRRPRVGILATGDEVLEPGQVIRDGQVYNSNSYSVAGLVRQAGAEPVVLPRVVDEPRALRRALSEAGGLDLLLTSGGVSMGSHDFVRDLLLKEGTVHFWKVAIRPGGPALFGEWRGLPVFGLPGNPVSSMVVFLLIARVWIHTALGLTEPLPWERRLVATAGSAFKGAGYKEAFRRATLTFDADRGYTVCSTGNQSSGVLTSMLAADCLAVVPLQRDIGVGERLEVIPLSEGQALGYRSG